MSSKGKGPLKEVSVFDRILDGFFFLGAIILAFIMLSVCWDVIARAVANKPLPWVLEFSEYSLLYMCFLCTAWVLRNNGHVISDLLLVRLHPKKQAFMNTATSILGALICLVLTIFGTYVSLEKLWAGSFQPSTIRPPDFPLFIIIPIGCALLTIQFLRRATRNYGIWKNGKNHDRGETETMADRAEGR
jgi:TRAP-type C4-dicarboxylate transport system permease small subunit